MGKASPHTVRSLPRWFTVRPSTPTTLGQAAEASFSEHPHRSGESLVAVASEHRESPLRLASRGIRVEHVHQTWRKARRQGLLQLGGRRGFEGRRSSVPRLLQRHAS